MNQNQPSEETWEPINGEVTYVKPSQLKEGDTIEGTFLETTVDQKFKTLKHTIKQGDGSTKVINGTGQLNHIMKDVAPGTRIKAVFLGKKILPSGPWKGTEANQWRVFKAKGAPVPAAALIPNGPPDKINEFIASQLAARRTNAIDEITSSVPQFAEVVVADGELPLV